MNKINRDIRDYLLADYRQNKSWEESKSKKDPSLFKNYNSNEKWCEGSRKYGLMRWTRMETLMRNHFYDLEY